MILNKTCISQRKLFELSAVLPLETLRHEYIEVGYSDREIAAKYGLSQSWASKLRRGLHSGIWMTDQ